jgi:hypothetical protein
LGLTLGFPPKAVEFYVTYYEWQLHDRSAAVAYYFSHKVGYRYAGVMCEGHIDDLIENAEWLWNRYGLVQDMAIKVIQKPKDELIEFSVGYRNVDDLLYAEDQVKKVLDHNQWVMSQIILT